MINDGDGLLGDKLPYGIDELCFYDNRIIKDVNRLKELFELFKEIIITMIKFGIIIDMEPGVYI